MTVFVAANIWSLQQIETTAAQNSAHKVEWRRGDKEIPLICEYPRREGTFNGSGKLAKF